MGTAPDSESRGLVPALLVFTIGVVVTIALFSTVWVLNRDNETRLLNLQAKQVASVLTAAIPTTQTPLQLGAELAQATNGNVQTFDTYLGAEVGPGREFETAELWQEADGVLRRVATIGDTDPSLAPTAMPLIDRAYGASTFVVSELRGASGRTLAYAYAQKGAAGQFAIYAVRPLPKDHQAAVASNSAFSDLYYAIYLGDAQHPVALLATDVPSFPIAGQHVTVHVPFGNTVLTTVVTARTPLAGSLPAQLPWIALVLGLLISLAAGLVTLRLVRRQRTAEVAEGETRRLYDELGTLYGQQRTIAETLQRTLLPLSPPDIPGLEVAMRFVPGARGIDIGGDWYSIVALDDGRFFFVIGDVSGRGLSAASIMARLRFTVRAYAMDGDPPSLILEKSAKQIDIDVDGHFATVLVGIGDVVRHEVTVANAGHLPPYLMSGDDRGYVTTPTGVPLGVSGGPYESVTFPVAPRSTLIVFTDGLVERRGESIDVGLSRFGDVANSQQGRHIDDLVDHAIEQLAFDASDDDVAILGVRWMG
jgi:serine phosphatase RsbU (regulator of sigma subunit)